MEIKNEYGHCHYCLCDDCAKIHNLYVKKEYRRKGYASELIKKAISEIRHCGYKGIIKIIAEPKENSISNDDLIKFYQKNDLEVVDS